MIIEFVTFKNRPGLSREEEIANAVHAAHEWIKHPELVAKHFFRDEEGTGGAVYFWPSKEAAQRAHDEKWRKGLVARTGGNEPQIRYFEFIATADAVNKKVIEYAVTEQATE